MSANYQFIAAEAANYPVVDLSRMLGVSRSGYYEWASRPESSDDLAPLIVGDITYLPLQGGGWAYLATWLDLYSRKIVGWQVAEAMTANLVIEAVAQVIRRERPAPGLIVHSDRGGQYVAAEFRALLKRSGFEQSMSRSEETYDNAHAESLFSRYKLATAGRRVAIECNDAQESGYASIQPYELWRKILALVVR
jgi:transposase InsO family protein